MPQTSSRETLEDKPGDADFADFFENSAIGLQSCGPDGVVLRANQALLDLLGYSRSEYVGQPVSRFYADAEVLADIVRRLKGRETIRNQAARLRCRDGSVKHVLVDTNARWDERGFVHTRCVIRDVTEQRRLSEELERCVDERTRDLLDSIQEHETFAYSVAHDLRAPVRAIHGLGQIIERYDSERLSERGLDCLARILAACRRMDGLIMGLLSYSRLGRHEIQRQRCELESVVQQALAALAHEIEERGAKVTVVGPLAPVVGDSMLLIQIATNLISNAIKFVPGGTAPKVSIRCQHAGPGVARLVVEDNGLGIPPEHHARVFKVFERLHADQSYPGTGIGLAIVSRAAERMGGRAGLESAAGKGSRFWIELPCETAMDHAHE